MARGVVFEDISPIADGLLVAGERPTVERVRQALGRGSPNTIGPLLDTWWAQLAQRHAKQLAMPGVPEAVASAFAHAWELAVDAGMAHAEAQVAPERAALAKALAEVDQARADVQTQLRQLEGSLHQAETAATARYHDWLLSERRNSETDRELAQAKAGLQQFGLQCEVLEARLADRQAQWEADRAAAAAERETLLAHARQSEDRAYSEIDRLRQDVKALKAELAAKAREHAVTLRAADQARRAAETEVQRVQRTCATLQGRLDARAAARTLARPRAKADASKRKKADT